MTLRMLSRGRVNLLLKSDINNCLERISTESRFNEVFHPCRLFKVYKRGHVM